MPLNAALYISYSDESEQDNIFLNITDLVQ